MLFRKFIMVINLKNPFLQSQYFLFLLNRILPGKEMAMMQMEVTHRTQTTAWNNWMVVLTVV